MNCRSPAVHTFDQSAHTRYAKRCIGCRMFDLIVRGGTIVSSDGLTRADVGIADGTIKAIAQAGETLTAAPEIDARDRFILPGLVDAHVHIPGYLLRHRPARYFAVSVLS